MSALHSQADKDNEAMVEDYQETLKQIFAYGYGCCAFKHGISGDRQGFRMACLTLSTHFLQSFFLPIWGAPLTPTAVKAKATKVHLVETTKDPVEGVAVEEQG